MRLIILVLITFLFSSCACHRACERLRILGCPEGQPLDDGTSCEDFCQEVEWQGHNLNTACIEDLQSCSAIEKCGNEQGKQ